MISVPGFLLRRLYLKGSLQNTAEGFQFQLRNQLGSGYAKKLLPLTVDGREVPLEETFFISETSPDRRISFSEVSEANPFTLAMNKTATIIIRGVTLTPGSHKIGMGFEVQGLGTLSFDFVDLVKDG